MPYKKQSMATPASRPTGVSKNIYFLTIAIVAVVGFVAGTRDQEIIGSIAPVFGFQVETGTLDLSSVQNTYQALKANYDGTLDTGALIDGASRGLVDAAGDQYTVFMDAEEAQAFRDDLAGNIGGGIGAEIGVRNDQPTIVRILADNPAQRAGLMKGDVVIKVNGQSVVGQTPAEVAQKIRGEVDTTVKLSVLRGDKTKVFSITRDTVNNPSVQSKVENDTGILTITRFDDETSSLARQAAQRFVQQGVTGVILDLRGNGGGYLNAAQEVAGLWLDDQVVVTERADGKVIDTLKSGGNPLLADIPTVVLVNGSSASASEIVAGALRDHDEAVLVGERTFGKGTVQKVIDLADGAVLKVTIARWYTPDGNNISKEGIAVDKKVIMTAEDINAGNDPQMNAAKKRLQ